nr:hypothetical protein [uncultured Rhodopila sp.]
MSNWRTRRRATDANDDHAISDDCADSPDLRPVKMASGTIDAIGSGIEVETRRHKPCRSAFQYAVSFAGRYEAEDGVTLVAIHRLVTALARQAAREAFVVANQGGWR